MFRTRVVSPGCLGVGVAVATTLATSLASSPRAHAQAQDLNLQTQLNIISPPPVGQTPPSTEVISDDYVTLDKGAGQLSCILVSSKEVLELVAAHVEMLATSKFSPKLKASVEYLSGHPDDVKRILARLIAQRNRSEKPLLGPPPSPVKFGCGFQPTTLKISFALNPTYESDILKKGDSNSPGESFGFNSNVLLTTAGLRPLDLFVLNAAEASTRYIPNASPSVDSVSGYFGYQYFLNAAGLVDGRMVPLDENSKNPPTPGLITISTAAFGIFNQTAYTPTFHSEKADLFTPLVTFARQNINLDDPRLGGCFSGKDAAFCHFADLSVMAGQTFSDVLAQDNFNLAGAANLGWRMSPELTLALQTMATGKYYEDVVGGRQDLLLQAGLAVTYSPATKFQISPTDIASVRFSLPITYYKNYSTVAAAEWSGLIVMPTFTIAFQPAVH